ncbi:MAG: hypothetical protein ABI477_14595 [Chryseolinea sp.]
MIKFFWIYRYISSPALTVTFIQASLQYITEWDDFVYFVWIKWFTMTVMVFYIYLTRSNDVYFYYNLGISTIRFYATMAAIDFLIFCTTMFIVIQLK